MRKSGKHHYDSIALWLQLRLQNGYRLWWDAQRGREEVYTPRFEKAAFAGKARPGEAVEILMPIVDGKKRVYKGRRDFRHAFPYTLVMLLYLCLIPIRSIRLFHQAEAPDLKIVSRQWKSAAMQNGIQILLRSGDGLKPIGVYQGFDHCFREKSRQGGAKVDVFDPQRQKT